MKKRRKQAAIFHPSTFILPILLFFLLLFTGLSVYGDDSQPDVPPISEDQPAPPQKNVFLTAPELIRVGDTVELTFCCNAEEIRAVQGSLVYDPELLTYVSSEPIPSDWRFSFSEEDGKLKYLGLSTENRGVTGKTALFTAYFKVNSTVPADSEITITASDTTAYDGQNEVMLEGGDFTFTAQRPLSSECTLNSLSIKGGNLSPAFSPEITEYTVNLPYSSHRADVVAIACPYGKLKYSNRDLAIGENTLTVTVISETGLQKVYTITVIRAADPNYVPSNDNRILKLNSEPALVLPTFSPEITEYTLYIVQGYDIFLTPTAAPKAVADGLFIRGIPAPGSDPKFPTAGTFTITCYAEDGTPRTYTFRSVLVASPEKLEEYQKQQEEPDYTVLMTICIIVFVMIVLVFVAYVIGRAHHPHEKHRRVKKESPDTDIPDESVIAVPVAETPTEAEPAAEESTEAEPVDAEPITETPEKAEPVAEASTEVTSPESETPKAETTAEENIPKENPPQSNSSGNKKKKKKKKH